MHACRAMASSFEVKAVVQGYHQYKARSGMHKLATTPCSAALFPIIASVQECTFHTGPSFLLLFESITERTSELEDAIDVDGQLLAISLNTILGAEAT